MITQWVLLGVGLLLVVGTALYVAAEFSLVTVDRATVNRLAVDGDQRARSLQHALKSLSTQLSGAQVGITVTTLALGWVMEPSLAALIAVPLRAAGLGYTTAASASVIIALVVATVLSMVFGELVAKNIAIAAPMGTARAVVTPLRVSTRIVMPLIWALNGVANGVLRLFHIEPQEELRSARSAAELISLVRRSADHGTLAAPTAGLLARSLSFFERDAGDAMTPRVRVDFLPATATPDEIIAAAVRTGHSRFPVVGADDDDVIGLVHVKRAVAVPPSGRARVTAGQLAVPVPVVPQTVPLDDVLDLLRARGLQMALVADEYGGTAGVLTLEDVVEELVGEIADEHDPAVHRPVRAPDGSWLLPGGLRPDEIAEATGVELPEGPAYETVAGLLMDRLGALPEPGDTVTLAAALRPSAWLGARDAVSGDEDIQPSGEDLPQSATVRLTAVRRVRRRVETVALSAVSAGEHERGDRW